MNVAILKHASIQRIMAMALALILMLGASLPSHAIGNEDGGPHTRYGAGYTVPEDFGLALGLSGTPALGHW